MFDRICRNFSFLATSTLYGISRGIGFTIFLPTEPFQRVCMSHNASFLPSIYGDDHISVRRRCSRFEMSITPIAIFVFGLTGFGCGLYRMLRSPAAAAPAAPLPHPAAYLRLLPLPEGLEKKSLEAGFPLQIPSKFICPITLEMMNDPVVASDGETYEKKSIEKWASEKKTSPKTRAPISRTVTPNASLKREIKEFRNNMVNKVIPLFCESKQMKQVTLEEKQLPRLRRSASVNDLHPLNSRHRMFGQLPVARHTTADDSALIGISLPPLPMKKVRKNNY